MTIDLGSSTSIIKDHLLDSSNALDRIRQFLDTLDSSSVSSISDDLDSVQSIISMLRALIIVHEKP
jgi:hypothetical protein